MRGQPLTPMTKLGYEKLLQRNVFPYFDETKLRQIQPEDVRKWQAKVTASKGGDQAAKSYRLLRAILNTAVAEELIVRNPCVIRGAGIERGRRAIRLEADVVLALADEIGPRLRAWILLAGFDGLRSGELLGLQRHDISTFCT